MFIESSIGYAERIAMSVLTCQMGETMNKVFLSRATCRPTAREDRGVPTAFSAPILEGKRLSMGDYIYVWPYAEGREKGQFVQPLFKSVTKAAH